MKKEREIYLVNLTNNKKSLLTELEKLFNQLHQIQLQKFHDLHHAFKKHR